MKQIIIVSYEDGYSDAVNTINKFLAKHKDVVDLLELKIIDDEELIYLILESSKEIKVIEKNEGEYTY
ncbi:MAG: hypothetical protein RSE41_10320, partial [Clostridia bacterium]